MKRSPLFLLISFLLTLSIQPFAYGAETLTMCSSTGAVDVCVQYSGRSRLYDLVPADIIAYGLHSPGHPKGDASEDNDSDPEDSGPKYAVPQDIPVEIYRIRITNRTVENLKISPSKFYLLTLNDEIVMFQRSIFEVIDWPGKMESTTLSPGGEVQGFLLFPYARGSYRKLVYGGHPGFDVRMY